MPKMELLDGSGTSYVEMVKRIVEDSERDGSEVIGVVVFAKNDASSELHTYIGSREWPTDLDLWPRLVDALGCTVADAQAQAAVKLPDPGDGSGPNGAN